MRNPKIVKFNNGKYGVRSKTDTVDVFYSIDMASTMTMPTDPEGSDWDIFESCYMMKENEARALFSSLKAADVKVDQRKTLTVTEID